MKNNTLHHPHARFKFSFPSGINSKFTTTAAEQEALAELAKSGLANHNNAQPGSFCVRSSSSRKLSGCPFSLFLSEFIPLIAGRQLVHPDPSGTKKSK
ncbi:hypothetical protein [Flavipsychrobacter stenotrophus]|uniref:hypothetical protein n=1 Tax=Flavipsychrobacter stenotrophus TaxID=2077091 RepID=UPI0010574CFD|nr:hypothetical protein [Flavipsychrobacter stenotrophus]